MRISVAAGAVLALGMTMAAQAEQAKAKPEKSGSGDDIVCFAEARTGSHLKKRICMTQAERERRMKEDQEAMAKFKGSGASSAAGGARNTGAVK